MKMCLRVFIVTSEERVQLTPWLNSEQIQPPIIIIIAIIETTDADDDDNLSGGLF